MPYKHSEITTLRSTRNSSIELLRIAAMFMILAHHFIIHNTFSVEQLPLGPEKIFLQLIMQGFGKVGVIIFFTISIWFLTDKEQTIKSCLCRIWILEREVLFWSICLAFWYLLVDKSDFSVKLFVKSFAPLSMGVWWYATAYAIFLALFPFLCKGLQLLGRKTHLALCITVITIWGILAFIPSTPTLSGVFGFVYVFILITFYKWYMEPFTIKQTIIMVIIGLAFFVLYTIISACLSLIDINVGLDITSDWKLPVIMIGFGLFLLFQHYSFHSAIINKIASSTFAIYLITDYAASEKLLWTRLFNLKMLYQRPLAILEILGILVIIYMVCTLLDFIRQALFTLTIDRNRGAWFTLLWNKIKIFNIRRLCDTFHIKLRDSNKI